MKICKFVHSCLLVETTERVALFDPGIFSWQSRLFDIELINRIDRLVITHEHADHLHIPFVRHVIKKFPNLHIVANKSVQQLLRQEGIKVTMRLSTDCTKPFRADHEMLPWAKTPNSTGFHFLNKLTHPGDSYSFWETKDILALPIVAPWGSMAGAVKLAIKLKPRVVLPIHDWHLNDEARSSAYETLAVLFAKHRIDFIKLINGKAIEL